MLRSKIVTEIFLVTGFSLDRHGSLPLGQASAENYQGSLPAAILWPMTAFGHAPVEDYHGNIHAKMF